MLQHVYQSRARACRGPGGGGRGGGGLDVGVPLTSARASGTRGSARAKDLRKLASDRAFGERGAGVSLAVISPCEMSPLASGLGVDVCTAATSADSSNAALGAFETRHTSSLLPEVTAAHSHARFMPTVCPLASTLTHFNRDGRVQGCAMRSGSTLLVSEHNQESAQLTCLSSQND